MDAQPKLLKSKLFWVALLYFSEGFPLGVFYEIFPVWFRQQGVDLKSIGAISLLGLAWTLKFMWAPAVDHYRGHRYWMATVDLAMGAVLVVFAWFAGFGPWVWVAIALFTILSATNDVAIDGYTIELLEKHELGVANGIRIGLYRVGMLASGVVLILSDWITWRGAFLCGAAILVACAVAVLAAPRERPVARGSGTTLRAELARIATDPKLAAVVLAFALGVLALVDQVTKWSHAHPAFWGIAFATAAAALAVCWLRNRNARVAGAVAEDPAKGPMFGALMELLERPYIWPVLAFILLFKLGDASMGFMVKPFWVDAGFTATEIGLVSVNIGLGLSIAGGLAGGWYTDRVGIFKGLWVLGLFQALSNLGYAAAAALIPYGAGTTPELWHRAVLYSASAAESFTGGLGTAAFLAFLMAIVDKRHSATEYALLSSVFALSRSLAGWASGFGAEAMGYASYFLLTFFLSFPAYLLLPWPKRMLAWADARPAAPAPASAA
ncbi:MAG TPA: MFS transporter [Burkholderiales bacterium]|nr:MFS transporter [Burkholderiales bacterium]